MIQRIEHNFQNNKTNSLWIQLKYKENENKKEFLGSEKCSIHRTEDQDIALVSFI